MNVKRIIAPAIAIAAATWVGNAFADDITLDTSRFSATKSRAEVRSELDRPYTGASTLKSSKSARELMDEYIASRREVAAFNGEDSGSAFLSRNVGNTGKTTTMGGPSR